jgi:hypothetical protein
MDQFVAGQNIKHFRQLLLKDGLSDTERQRLLRLLREEEAKLMKAVDWVTKPAQWIDAAVKKTGVGRTQTVQITTRTAVISIDAIQTAYNDAVMSGRMALAREIGQLWLSTLAEQKVRVLQSRSRAYATDLDRSRIMILSRRG